MKTITTIAIAIASFTAVALAAEDEGFDARDYKTIPRFGIPDEFYTDHYYFPVVYLRNWQNNTENTTLSKSEKLSAALLIIAADHATTEKYHQSYQVNVKSPLMSLLTKNFRELSAVTAFHDVDTGGVLIRDLGDFFRTWLQTELSAKAQNERIKRAFESVE